MKNLEVRKFKFKYNHGGTIPADTGRKLNVHKTFRRRPGCLLNVLFTFNLRPVSTELFLNVCKQPFHISHVRLSQKVKGVLM